MSFLDIESIEELFNFFSKEEIQKMSGVEKSSDNSKLFLFNNMDIQEENIHKKLMTLPPIEVDNVYKGRRTHCIVYYGNHFFGLNTENNCRKALSKWFQSNGFKTIFEFDDIDQRNIKTISLESDIKNKLISKKNTRDLLAYKIENNNRKIWFCEIKGHSAAETWDLFDGLKQLETLFQFRDKVLSFHNEKGKDNLEIKLAFVYPGQPNILHNGRSCYEKEFKKIRECVENPNNLNKFRNKKTYEHFVRLCDTRNLLKELSLNHPHVYLLSVYTIDNIINPINGNSIKL